MGTITSWTGFSGSDVDATELADAMFDPDNTYNAFGVLHGRMNDANYAGTIPTWAVQEGTFFCGFYHGFERWHWAYARQLQGGPRGSDFVVKHAALSRRFFMPWDAKAVLLGYQVWCRQDATIWDTDGSPIREGWGLTPYLDGVIRNTGVGLMHAQETIDTPSSAAALNPDNASESRWRYVTSSFGLVSSSTSNPAQLTKGFHTFELAVFADIEDPDPFIHKLAMPTGAVWMFAIR